MSLAALPSGGPHSGLQHLAGILGNLEEKSGCQQQGRRWGGQLLAPREAVPRGGCQAGLLASSSEGWGLVVSQGAEGAAQEAQAGRPGQAAGCLRMPWAEGDQEEATVQGVPRG